MLWNVYPIFFHFPMSLFPLYFNFLKHVRNKLVPHKPISAPFLLYPRLSWGLRHPLQTVQIPPLLTASTEILSHHLVSEHHRGAVLEIDTSNVCDSGIEENARMIILGRDIYAFSLNSHCVLFSCLQWI